MWTTVAVRRGLGYVLRVFAGVGESVGLARQVGVSRRVGLARQFGLSRRRAGGRRRAGISRRRAGLARQVGISRRRAGLARQVGISRRVATACLAVGLASAGLAGCSGSSEKPRTLPPLSTTPAASSASSSPADEQTALAEATAVVRQYFHLLNGPTTLETAHALENLMTSGCECRKVASSTAAIARRGQHYFGQSRLVSITPSIDGPGAADALVQYDFTRGGIRAADGSIVSQTPGRVGALVSFVLERQNGGWLIARVAVLKPGTRR